MPRQLQFNIEFLLLRARQLAYVFATTITNLNTNITYDTSDYRVSFMVILAILNLAESIISENIPVKTSVKT